MSLFNKKSSEKGYLTSEFGSKKERTKTVYYKCPVCFYAFAEIIPIKNYEIKICPQCNSKMRTESEFLP